MNYSIRQIASIINGEFQPEISKDISIRHLLYDSRLLIQPIETLFFALIGQRNDGHHYIDALYQNGVRAFVISKKTAIKDYPDAHFILVKNTLEALQNIAKFHRSQFNIPTIGITGSNGKTVVKEWLHQLLEGHFRIVRSPKSYNSQIGVPMSVAQIEPIHNLAIFEAGISTTNEMQRLADIVQPTIGIFTNIGDAHNDGFQSIEQKVQEKILLFKNAKIIIYCKDDARIDAALKNLKKTQNPSLQLFNWSTSESGYFHSIFIKKATHETVITGIYTNEKITITIPFVDDASIENAIHCWLVSLHLGLKMVEITPPFQRLSPVALRLELMGGINHCTLVNDSYSADLASLTIALNFLQQQNTHQKQTVILSDFLEHNDATADIYEAIAQLLIQKKVNKLIAIGDSIQRIFPFLKNKITVKYYVSTKAFLQQIIPNDFDHETILIKGARTFQFEKIANRLALKVHQTTLEINLNALIHNLNIYRNLLEPETLLMAMVKASAYGSGSDEVAKILEFNRVNYLAVAYSDEGVELRKSGINLPILVLNPEAASFDSIIRYQLEPEIYSFSLLDDFQNYLASFNFSEPYPIHIKVNTGMNRLGFEAAEAEQLASRLAQNKVLKVASIFSHLAGSDAAAFDDFTEKQVARFKDFYKKIVQQLPYQPLRHILNSSGISRFKQHQMDMVRLGIGLYGIDGNPNIQQHLETVSTLKATISQIKNIPITETVGYNRSGKIQQPIRSATISIGYADGLMRHAGNGQIKVLIRGQEVPIIGNVCMDMCMIDVTDVPVVKEGDEVIIFGTDQPIQHLAKALNTIPYEIFTNISPRVKRVYFQE
jgi:alanine racemase